LGKVILQLVDSFGCGVEKTIFSGCKKMPRCKALASLSPAVQAGNPEE